MASMDKTKGAAKVQRVNADKLHRQVQMYIPPARAGEEREFYVAVNGKGMYVPKGKTVTLPRYVADHLRQVIRLEERYERTVAETHEKQLSEALR